MLTQEVGGKNLGKLAYEILEYSLIDFKLHSKLTRFKVQLYLIITLLL